MEREFTAVYERDGEWFIGWVEELPGAFGQGRTLDEVREDLREAVKLLLECAPELADTARRERVTEVMSVAVY